MRAATSLLAALVLPAALAAAPAPGATFALAITGGKVDPARSVLRVSQGATVVVRITADAPGEAHLHAYRLAATVGPGRDAEWRFVARATGRFRIEWHAKGAGASHSHGPPLATLEVVPP